jgi:diguanylate cyclase (GGDEF)-like protein/PAS domain S-box-containing protein
MSIPLRVLILEDSEVDAGLMVAELRQAGYEPDWVRVETEEKYKAQLESKYDIVLADYRLLRTNGDGAPGLLDVAHGKIPLIIVSGTIDAEEAARIIKLGAADFLLKDRMARLGPAVTQALTSKEQHEKLLLAEMKLRDSEQRFRQIAENIKEVFWLTDPSKNQVLYISPAYEDIWGRSSDSLYVSPRAWAEAIHPEDRARVLEAAQTKQVRGDYVEEYRIVRSDGSIRWIRDRAFPVVGKEGKVFRIAGIAEDITQRKQFEEEVRDTRNFLASIFDNIPNMIFVKDAEDLRFVRLNPAGEKLMGYSEKELLGKYDYDFFPKDQADFFVAKDRETLASGERVLVVEETITIKDGTQKILQTKKLPILGKDGTPRYLLGFAEDITERKQAELRLLESEAKLRKLIDGMGPNIFVGLMTPNGVLVEASESALAAAGLKTRDVLGRPFEQTYWWAYSLQVQQQLRSAIRQATAGKACRYDVQIRVAPDALIWIDFSLNPLRDESGQVTFLVPSATVINERKLAEEALRESELRFRRVAEQSPDAIVIHQDGKIVFANDALVRLMRAASAADLVGRSALSLVQPERRQFIEQRIQQLYAGRNLPLSEQVYVRLDGTVVEVEIASSPFMLEGKSAALVTVRDITERKEQERRIARLSRIQQVLSGINSAIVRIRDRQELFNEACRIAVEHGGFRMAWIGLVDKSTNKVVPIAQTGFHGEFLEFARLSIEDDTFKGQGPIGKAIRRKTPIVINDIATAPQMAGRQEQMDLGLRSKVALPLLVGGEAVGTLSLYASEPGFFDDDDEMKLLLELAGDIALAMEYIEKEERLNYLAYYDALTGLANNTLFRDRLGQFIHAAKRDEKSVAVLLINLDRFRQFNDTLGRHAGDTLLKMVAERLGEALREPVSLARTGGDSFAIAIADIKYEDDVASLLQDRIFGILGRPFQLNSEEIRISAKAGVALYPGDGNDAETLFRNAEAALKQAKTSGERYLFYAPEMNARVAEKLMLENKLRQAVERKEFVLHYQPKVDVVSRKIVGLEALIRWNNPESGLVAPAQFIPLLEETGMILEVGLWAIRQTLEDCRLWREQGLKAPRVAVNVSALQLRQKDFVDVVKQALLAFGGESYELGLEITESLIMHDIEDNIGKLAAIKTMGIDIAIDDFGTGYSSLSYLARLPVNALKIDRSFIVGMTTSPDSATIVSIVISLAHSLGLIVIAEGVETEEQSKMLRLLKCDEMQGFFISRPIPPDKIAALLAR